MEERQKQIQFVPEDIENLKGFLEQLAMRGILNTIDNLATKESVKDVKVELKEDIKELKVELKEDISKLDTCIDKVEQKLETFATKDDIKEVKTELNSRIDKVEQKIESVRNEINSVRNEISSNFKWTMTAILGAVIGTAGSTAGIVFALLKYFQH